MKKNSLLGKRRDTMSRLNTKCKTKLACAELTLKCAKCGIAKFSGLIKCFEELINYQENISASFYQYQG